MPTQLDPVECRVVGCLLEKSVVTPDQYPITLNALTNAGNQKSSRAPVMNLSSGEVMRAIRSLQDKHLVRVEENFRTQVEKYTHRFCNTPFSDYQFDEAQYAIMTVLLLRGPRTPGELRANSGRLHAFDSNQSVVEACQNLLNREGGAVITQLPRSPGRKDAEYMHLLGDGELPEGALESTPARSADRPPHQNEQTTEQVEETPTSSRADEGGTIDTRRLSERVAQLEAELVGLKQDIEALKRQRGACAPRIKKDQKF